MIFGHLRIDILDREPVSLHWVWQSQTYDAWVWYLTMYGTLQHISNLIWWSRLFFKIIWLNYNYIYFNLARERFLLNYLNRFKYYPQNLPLYKFFCYLLHIYAILDQALCLISVFIYLFNTNNGYYGFEILLVMWGYILHCNQVGTKYLPLPHKVL